MHLNLIRLVAAVGIFASSSTGLRSTVASVPDQRYLRDGAQPPNEEERQSPVALEDVVNALAPQTNSWMKRSILSKLLPDDAETKALKTLAGVRKSEAGAHDSMILASEKAKLLMTYKFDPEKAFGVLVKLQPKDDVLSEGFFLTWSAYMKLNNLDNEASLAIMIKHFGEVPLAKSLQSSTDALAARTFQDMLSTRWVKQGKSIEKVLQELKRNSAEVFPEWMEHTVMAYAKVFYKGVDNAEGKIKSVQHSFDILKSNMGVKHEIPR